MMLEILHKRQKKVSTLIIILIKWLIHFQLDRASDAVLNHQEFMEIQKMTT